MSQTPTLSLIMIVRDEEDMLPGFLESAGDLFDEMIIVDTGSTDETVNIATAAGATVHHYTWTDDFAAARNVSLSHATGTWVAFFDADERLSEELVRQIQGLTMPAKSRIGAATVTMRNRLPSGSVHDAPLLRIFRRDDSICFKHRIHEDISESVNAYLTQQMMTTVNLSGIVEHLGYVREVAASRDKFNRDRRLLESCIEADPSDLYSHYKLMEQARYWEDTALWADIAAKTAQLLERSTQDDVRAYHFCAEMVCLTVNGLYPTDYEGAYRWLHPWMHPANRSPVLAYWMGYFCEQTQRLQHAKEHYLRCLDLPAARDKQMGAVRPLMGLCRLSLFQGDLNAAATWTQKALAINPADDEVIVAARAMADTYISDGFGQLAANLMAPLAGHPPQGPDGITQGRALLLAGKPQEAKDVVIQLVKELPEAGIGVLVCNLCMGEHTDLELDISQEDADIALRAWVHTALRSQNQEVAVTFCDTAGLITGIFPWLEGYVIEMLGGAQNDQPTP